MDQTRDQLVISDLGLSMVYIAGTNGDKLGSLGVGMGNQPNCYREPSDVMADALGNIIVAGSKNNRLQLYSKDFAYGGLVELERRITRPSDIYLTQDNHMLVVNYLGHAINMYKLSIG